MNIGIDINNVLRAFNEQVITYYEKCYNTTIELGEKKPEDVSLSDILKFKSNIEKNRFFYEDYPYEIFGCATTMEVMLLPHLNEWIKDMEDKGNQIYMISVGEHILSMQSTMFFLSKIGVKCRYTYMPKDLSELNGKIDVLVTANPKVIKNKFPQITIIGVNRGYNQDVINKSDIIVNNLEDVFKMKSKDFKKKSNVNIFSKILSKFSK